MTSNALNNLELAINPLIADLKSPTSTSIRGLIEQLRVAFPISDDEAESLLRRLEARHQVQMGQGNVRLFEWDGATSTWVQKGGDIDGEAADDYSGHSVSLSDDGSIVAIGAIFKVGV